MNAFKISIINFSSFGFGVPAYVPTISKFGISFTNFSAAISATPSWAPSKKTFSFFVAAILQIFFIKSTPVIRSGITVLMYILLNGIMERLTSHFENLLQFDSKNEVISLNFDAHKIPVPSARLKSALFKIFLYSSSFCAASKISGFGVTIMCLLFQCSPGLNQFSTVFSAAFLVIASKFTPRIFTVFRI